MGRVDDRAADAPGEGQAEHGVVVPVVPAALRLPSLAHGARAAGPVQRARGGIKVVAAGDDEPAVLLAGEVDGQVLEATRVGHDLSVYPEPGDPAVGVGG